MRIGDDGASVTGAVKVRARPVDPSVMVAVRRSPAGRRSERGDRRPRYAPAHGDAIVALVVEGDDGRCTALGSAVWRAFTTPDDEWGDRHEAMAAAGTALGSELAWRQIGPGTWAASTVVAVAERGPVLTGP